MISAKHREQRQQHSAQERLAARPRHQQAAAAAAEGRCRARAHALALHQLPVTPACRCTKARSMGCSPCTCCQAAPPLGGPSGANPKFPSCTPPLGDYRKSGRRKAGGRRSGGAGSSTVAAIELVRCRIDMLKRWAVVCTAHHPVCRFSWPAQHRQHVRPMPSLQAPSPADRHSSQLLSVSAFL